MSVGLVYDPIYLQHDTTDHVENSRRLTETVAVLEKSGLLKQLVLMPPRAATVDEVATVHSREHISNIEKTCRAGGGWIDADTVASSASYQVALFAAGGAIAGLEAIMGQGTAPVSKVFALVRPPGHHATRDRAMGFCLFNNVAIAARLALDRFALERVAIVDFDVHHGNGTQDIFYHEPRVLYCSTHQWPLYPGTGALDDTGGQGAEGTKVNVPLPPGSGDAEYLSVFDRILVPLARRFRPQLILVSAGYDAHWADSLAMMQVSVAGFAAMTQRLCELAEELCQGRLLLSLEGGYHLKALPSSIQATLSALLGKSHGQDPLGPPPSKRATPSIGHLLEQAARIHRLG